MDRERLKNGIWYVQCADAFLVKTLFLVWHYYWRWNTNNNIIVELVKSIPYPLMLIMKFVWCLFLCKCLCLQRTGAWSPSPLITRHTCKRHSRTREKRICTCTHSLSENQQKESQRFRFIPGLQSSQNLQDDSNNKSRIRIRSFVRFLALNLRRFLWPGLSKNFDASLDAPLPPLGPLGCPFLGNNILAGSRKKGPEYLYSKISAMLNHPRIWRFYFMGQYVVSVSGSKNVRAVLQSPNFNIVSYEASSPTSKSKSKSESESVSNKDSNNHHQATKRKRPVLFSANSVMFEADKGRHQYLRKLVGSAFTKKAVQRGMPKIVKAAKDQISRIKATGTGTETETGIVNMEEICESFALDIAWRQILGLDLEDDEHEIERFHNAVNRYVSGVFSVLTYVNLPLRLKALTPPYRARRYLVSKIEERIQYLKENGPDGSTLSEMIFTSASESAEADGSQNGLSDDDVIENALILLVAGTETTASTLTSAIYFLGLHSRTWKKLAEEQEDNISKHGTTGSSHFSKDFLDDCVYLDAVIKETMRLVPISGVNLRRSEDTIILDGKQVPKGTSVFCNIRLTHELDPSIQSSSPMDPLTSFVPERWLDVETMPTDDFMPFGTGPRRCLGASLAMAEMRVFLSIFSRRVVTFELRDFINRDRDDIIIHWKPTSIIPKPLGGVPINAKHQEV